MAATTLYPTTLSKRKIRLLTILPSGEDLQVPLVCELQEWFIVFAPQYEALSYCWGDPKNQTDMNCNGLTISVTTSLHDALKRLRFKDKPRVIWADALCINQSNSEEKNFQVSSMGRTYAAAKRVVVWLGHADKSHALQIEEVMQDIREAFPQLNDVIDTSIIFKHVTKANLSSKLYKVLPWKVIGDLFHNPWFTRTWVIQEIRLASEAVVYWGESQIYWLDIAKLALWLGAEQTKGQTLPLVQYGYALMMVSKIRLDGGSRICNALSKFQGFMATDSRDHVYGILGLPELNEEKHTVTVDYTIPVAELYTKVAVAIMRQTQNLLILQYVGHPADYDGDPDFQSWTPRWDSREMRPEIQNPRDCLRPHFQFDLSPAFLDEICENTRELSLNGLLFDVVSRVDEIPDLKDFFANRASSQSGDSSESETHLFLQYWHIHVSCDPPFLASDQSAILSLAHTLSIGEVTLGSAIHWEASEEEKKVYLEAFLHFIDSLRKETQNPREQSHTVDTELGVAEKRFRWFVDRISHRHVLFECPNGSYGLGPSCLEEGDVIVQLEGGITPSALRHRDGEYLLLGQVYVDSIMNGELVALMEEGRIQKQEFCII